VVIRMGKTVFMFPGQGSQYIGMGKEFYEQIPICKEVSSIDKMEDFIQFIGSHVEAGAC
jgi:malonyl CoA-acyl carrier protein transacylase